MSEREALYAWWLCSVSCHSPLSSPVSRLLNLPDAKTIEICSGAQTGRHPITDPKSNVQSLAKRRVPGFVNLPSCFCFPLLHGLPATFTHNVAYILYYPWEFWNGYLDMKKGYKAPKNPFLLEFRCVLFVSCSFEWVLAPKRAQSQKRFPTLFRGLHFILSVGVLKWLFGHEKGV